VATVSVSPGTATLMVGRTVQLTATPRDAAGAPLTRSVTWSSQSSTVASVSSTGLVTALAPGQAQITATSESASAQVTIAVTPVPIASIALSTPSTMVPGASQTLIATVRDSAGTVLTGRSIAWTSATPTVATVSATGVVSALTAGSTRIAATAEGRTIDVVVVVRDGGFITPAGGVAHGVDGVVTLTVPAQAVSNGVALTIDPITTPPAHPELLSGTATRIAPDSVSFSVNATLRISYGTLPASRRATQLRVHQWTGSAWMMLASTVDTVSRQVRADVRGTGQFAVIEVPVAVGQVIVTPSTAELQIGETLQLSASVRAADGAVLSDRAVEWRSSNSALATVSNSGLVTAVAPGANVAISAVSEGRSDTARITIREPFAFADIYTGAFHTCAVSNGGEAWCWGANSSCELGLSACGGSRPTPNRVSTALRFSHLALGQDYTCGLGADSTAWCWGRSDRGNLGTTTTGASATPTAVSGGRRFTQLSAGYRHVCALDAAGAAWCWGANNDGQLGLGTDAAQMSTPTRVTGDLTFTSIGTGSEHTCGLTAEGAAWCWGENSDGESGNGAGIDVSQPVRVSGGHNFSALSVGEFHACGVSANGALWCWGWNESGQIGDGSTASRFTPVAVSGGDRYVAVRAFGWSTCAITVEGAAKCWGENFEGQLGNGGSGDQSVPVNASGSLRFVRFSTGGLAYHTCGLTTGGEWYCWGWNNNGQIGDGSYTDRRTPIRLPVPSGRSQATVGPRK
jgi:alpha-tubulin suppressor-like RCC1 family protein